MQNSIVCQKAGSYLARIIVHVVYQILCIFSLVTLTQIFPNKLKQKITYPPSKLHEVVLKMSNNFMKDVDVQNLRLSDLLKDNFLTETSDNEVDII